MPHPPAPLDLDAIYSLLAKATPGLLWAQPDSFATTQHESGMREFAPNYKAEFPSWSVYDRSGMFVANCGVHEWTEAYAAIIVACVNAAPALVSELRAAREARTKIVSDLYRVLGCVEDLMNCEGWGKADPDSRAGKLNAACAMAEATLSRAATGGAS